MKKFIYKGLIQWGIMVNHPHMQGLTWIIAYHHASNIAPTVSASEVPCSAPEPVA